MPTGLLTDGQRAFVRGAKDVSNPDSYRSNTRYRVRQRMDQIEEDLRVLQEHGQDDLVDEFYARFGRAAQLEARVDELEAQLAEEREE